MRRIESIEIKIVKASLDKVFNNLCLKNDLLPKYITINYLDLLYTPYTSKNVEISHRF